MRASALVASCAPWAVGAVCASACAPAPPLVELPAASIVAAPSLPGQPRRAPPPSPAQQATCEEAVKVLDPRGKGFTRGASGRSLNNGAYLGRCQVPTTSRVEVCVATQHGALVGLSVSLEPPEPSLERCVASGVRGLVFPASPELDVTRSVFSEQ